MLEANRAVAAARLRSGMAETERARRWAATMHGHAGGAPRVRVAHADSVAEIAPGPIQGREERETREGTGMADGATRAWGAGNRVRPEEPDPLRTCFER